MHGPRSLLVAVWCATAAAAHAQDRSSCTSCHEPEARAETGTAHAGGAARCTDCHKGDAAAVTREGAHAAVKALSRAVEQIAARVAADVNSLNAP